MSWLAGPIGSIAGQRTTDWTFVLDAALAIARRVIELDLNWVRRRQACRFAAAYQEDGPVR